VKRASVTTCLGADGQLQGREEKTAGVYKEAGYGREVVPSTADMGGSEAK
jgi:hypothetical protein